MSASTSWLSHIILILLILASLAFTSKRLMRLLHYFQQEEYDNARFLSWIWRHGLDRYVSMVLVLLGCTMGIMVSPLFSVLAASTLMMSFLRETDPRRADQSKKPLAMTPRAYRLLIVAFSLVLILALLAFMDIDLAARGPGYPIALALVVVIQLLPVLLVAANILLWPLEEAGRRRYLREAKAKLERLKPCVIGITGSFGKTSCKHILGHILSAQSPTLVTPGSVNTLLGVAGVVRGQLSDQHRFFVVEMGAYGPGSIDRLCRLFPPNHAAITAIGTAHYERFKTLSAVAQAKFEIATAATAQGGTVVLNIDAMDEEFWQSRVEPDHFCLVSAQDHPEAPTIRILHVSQTTAGLSFTLRHQGQDYAIQAPLWGVHHVGNMAVAFALAVRCGVSPVMAAAALSHMPQISHRLEVRRTPGAPTVIDDAYNSNPGGFQVALEVLDLLAKESKGRRILVTPGLVELGVRHDPEHRFLGEQSAQWADIVLVIAAIRIPTFMQGLRASERQDLQIETFPGFAAAKAWLNSNLRNNDVVLYENDLPDLYESPPKW
ncbi:MAG: UDP-N-acetylmuramoyl-tripeptide--D-alanyl-D-alanine ligase [Alphaproteobacteria bacterium]|nr:MAG: UDP-N-acetylmuramoyl-tripeptide--D-alanyl-D-alanine ligase [Alphaproteobacteria bacterium]